MRWVTFSLIGWLGCGLLQVGQAEPTLTFSNTMEWNPEYLAYTRKEPQLLSANWQQQITLTPPPANDSAITRQELQMLLTRLSERPAAQQGIMDERDVNLFRLGELRYGDLMDAEKYPATKALLDAVYHDLGVVTFSVKKYFDRVRPSFLEPKLELLIPNPGHPAYPSGHSTCAHTFALILGDLVPAQKEAMWRDAGLIADRREIAGVHYASDSEAGRQLAQQMYQAFQQSPAYQEKFKAAAAEWSAFKP